MGYINSVSPNKASPSKNKKKKKKTFAIQMQQEDSIKKLCMISSTSRNIFMGKYNSKTPVKLLGMIIRNY